MLLIPARLICVMLLVVLQIRLPQARSVLPFNPTFWLVACLVSNRLIRCADFLPFECPQCHHTYCLDHHTPASHSCTAALDLTKQNVMPKCPVCNQTIHVLLNESLDRRVSVKRSAAKGRERGEGEGTE